MTAVQCSFPLRGVGLCALLYVSAGGLALVAAAPAMAQNCGALGSPYSVGGCVVPGQYGSPSVRIKADPINPGGFRSTPVSPAPSFNGPMPPGLNRDYRLPPGIY